MEIYFKSKKMRKLCEDKKKMIKAYGKIRADKLAERLDDMYVAATLEDTRNLPGNYHELTEDRKGQWACDLDQPYRLVFEPTVKPIPTDAHGKYIWSAITIVEIQEIVDYHH